MTRKPRKFKNSFQKLSPKVQKRLKKIRLLALDVDGVMTDGRVFWIEGTGWTRQFSVKDGYGIKLVMRAGIDIAIISGGDSKSVRERAEWLGVKHVYLGDENKLIALDKIMKDTGLTHEEIAFVGDDLFDIPVLERVGFSATVPDAVPEVCAIVDYITKDVGGHGAVREICDIVRHATQSK